MLYDLVRLGGMEENESRLRRKKLRLWQTGQYRVRRQVGELPFCVFAASIIWRRHDPMSLWALFGFGPKRGCFMVQKRNETPETLETPETFSVDVRIAFLSTFQRTYWQI